MIKTLFFTIYKIKDICFDNPKRQIHVNMVEFHRIMEHNKKQKPVVPVLFHMNCFRRTDIDAGLAVYTHILIDFGLIIFHGNSGCPGIHLRRSRIR